MEDLPKKDVIDFSLECWFMQRLLEMATNRHVGFLPLVITFDDIPNSNSLKNPSYCAVCTPEQENDIEEMLDKMLSVLSVTEAKIAIVALDTSFSTSSTEQEEHEKDTFAIQVVLLRRDGTYEHRWFPYLISDLGQVYWFKFQSDSTPMIGIIEKVLPLAEKWFAIPKPNNFVLKDYTAYLLEYDIHLDTYANGMYSSKNIFDFSRNH